MLFRSGRSLHGLQSLRHFPCFTFRGRWSTWDGGFCICGRAEWRGETAQNRLCKPPPSSWRLARPQVSALRARRPHLDLAPRLGQAPRPAASTCVWCGHPAGRPAPPVSGRTLPTRAQGRAGGNRHLHLGGSQDLSSSRLSRLQSLPCKENGKGTLLEGPWLVVRRQARCHQTHVLKLVLNARLEIGRASCRERV